MESITHFSDMTTSGHSKEDRKYFSILWTCTKLPPVFKTFVLSIIEWLLKTPLNGRVVSPFLRETLRMQSAQN